MGPGVVVVFVLVDPRSSTVRGRSEETYEYEEKEEPERGGDDF